jgi:hypothetical protein
MFIVIFISLTLPALRLGRRDAKRRCRRILSQCAHYGLAENGQPVASTLELRLTIAAH